MKGKGIQHLNRAGKGDQLVRIQIETPEKLSKREKELLEQLGAEPHFAPVGVPGASEPRSEKAEEESSIFGNMKSIFS
jgi:DnaJ-class molecular chaperone